MECAASNAASSLTPCLENTAQKKNGRQKKRMPFENRFLNKSLWFGHVLACFDFTQCRASLRTPIFVGSALALSCHFGGSCLHSRPAECSSECFECHAIVYVATAAERCAFCNYKATTLSFVARHAYRTSKCLALYAQTRRHAKRNAHFSGLLLVRTYETNSGQKSSTQI